MKLTTSRKSASITDAVTRTAQLRIWYIFTEGHFIGVPVKLNSLFMM